MKTPLKLLAAAGLLAASATFANAAPANVGSVADGVSTALTPVDGFHRGCRRGRGGWHRHNRFGERRSCRVWRGYGRRPDSCVRFGPVWYCEY
jgi:hypothetical protein